MMYNVVSTLKRRRVSTGSYFSQPLLFRTSIFHNSHLTDFSEQVVLREAFFGTAYLTDFFLTFISLLFHLVHLFKQL